MTVSAVINQVPPDYWDTWGAMHPLQRLYHTSRFGAIQRIFRRVRHGARVLDVACGSGFALGRIFSHRPDLQVTGVDISTKHIAYARSTRPQFTFIEAAAEALPFADGVFSAVTCLDTIEHVVDPARVLQEAYRTLEPGGWLVVQLVFEDHLLFRPIWKWWLRSHGAVWNQAHVRVIRPRQLRQMLEQAGFQSIGLRMMHMGMSGIAVGQKPQATTHAGR